MKRFLLAVACLICAVAVAVPANAAVNLTIGDLLGVSVPGTPADEDEELIRLNYAIGLYNSSITSQNDGDSPTDHDFLIASYGGWGSNIPVAPLAFATGGFQVDSSDVSGFDITGYSWISIKLGQDQAFYYLDGQTGTLGSYFDPFPVSDKGKGGGLSHITLFGPGITQVPEGATLMLLGFGLAGISTMRRFLKR